MNLRWAREARGLTQEAVGGRCQLAPTDLGKIERGERGLEPEDAVKLARVLAITHDAVYRGVHWDQRTMRFVVEPPSPAPG
jgi:transcriptional regulator with XRE-family HTH domain